MNEPVRNEEESVARAAATVERLPRVKGCDGSLSDPEWELRLPDGWRFAGEAVHSLTCSSRAEATRERRGAAIERCPSDCSCREEEES